MSDASDLVIDVKNLSKVYRIPRSGHRKLAGSLSLVFNNLIRRPEKVPRGYYAFEALKPMDLKIRKGEAVGIIGRNGSGKSTLLQLVTGTLGATTGQVRINGSGLSRRGKPQRPVGGSCIVAATGLKIGGCRLNRHGPGNQSAYY